jgi:hypothetical protein
LAGPDTRLPSAFGFFTVIRNERADLFGGYLVLNANGRPLEFHCTAPVRTNRAQEILFGATLEPYLYGEQIGHTLLTKAETAADVVCTDVPAALAVRQHVQMPVAWLIPDNHVTMSSPGDAFRVDTPHLQASRPFSLRHAQLAVAVGYERDESLVTERLAALAERLPLSEPFARIREAIDEAQRGAR